MKKLLAIAAVAALGLGAATPALAGNTCAFNGRQESCSVSRNGAGYSVRWNSDGKVVHYNVSGNSVTIVEDNGRRSGGRASFNGGYLVVYSTNGNTTSIPVGGHSAPASCSYQGAGAATAINGHGNTVINQFIQAK